MEHCLIAGPGSTRTLSRTGAMCDQPAMDRRDFLCSAAAGAVAGVAAPAAAAPRPRIRDANRTAPVAADAVDTSGAWAEIDLSRVAFNLDQTRRAARGRRVMGVVKADAYGHGLVPVARLLEARGVDSLMVGNLREAGALREAGVKIPVLNYGPVGAGGAALLAARGIAQAVFTDEVRDLARAAEAAGRTIDVHVVVDTGLGRLGVPHGRASAFLDLVAALRGVRIAGIMTALTEDKGFDAEQLARFGRVCAEAAVRKIAIGLRHAASSGAMLHYGDDFLLDMVRPGSLLYGQYPDDETAGTRPIELRPALTFKARVAYVKTLATGESVSYHRAFTAREPTAVATLPVGYFDGYPPALAGKGAVAIHGRPCPVVAVTANHTVVRLRAESDAQIGDEAILWGPGADGTPASAGPRVEEVARLAQSSDYRLLIQLNPLLPRVYRGA